MVILGWTVPRLGGDIACTTRLSAPQIRDLSLESTPLNLLAAVLFVAKHADADARARCTFYSFPDPTVSTRVYTTKVPEKNR
jgi:hypothetical protein